MADRSTDDRAYCVAATYFVAVGEPTDGAETGVAAGVGGADHEERELAVAVAGDRRAEIVAFALTRPGHELADRAGAKQRPFRIDGPAGGDIGLAISLEGNGLAVGADGDDGAGDVAGFDGIGDDAV